MVRRWPSTGGFLIAFLVPPVELQYLGLDRLRSQELSSDAAEEDAFCAQVLRIGAKRWEDDWNRTQARPGSRKTTDEETEA